MPGLVAFGRRWSVGGDDFVFGQLTEAFFRFAWLGVLLSIFVVNHTGHALHIPTTPGNGTFGQCDESWNLGLYILGLLLIYSVTLVLCCTTAYVSSLGTILNPLPRRRLPFLIYARGLVLLVELGWNIAGTVWILGQTEGCLFSLLLAVKLTLAGSCVLLFGFFIGLYLVFDPLGGADRKKDVSLSTQKARTMWKNRLKWLLFCARGDDRALDAFEEVAALLANFFKDTDLVVSDTWAGMLILVNEARPLSIRRPPVTKEGVPAGWMRVELAVRMMEFALGTYGWPYYVWDAPCSPGRLGALVRTLHCCGCNQSLVMRDDCCHCNTGALRLQTRLEPVDLFHVSFKNSVMEVPFVVAADPETRSIVVAIRGTLSLKDAVTDLCAADESLRLVEGDDSMRTIRVHKGILAAARYVFDSLTFGKILEDVEVLYPDYALTITGHSLGAGVASVVAMLLRPLYPAIRCFAFSPPGCVVSLDGLPTTLDFILSVVVGDDLICRLSYDTMHLLKTDIIQAIQLCQRPKYDILISGCFKLICGTNKSIIHEDAEAPVSSSPFSRDLRTASQEEPLLSDSSSPRRVSYTEEDLLGSPKTLNGNGSVEDCRHCSLHIPGRILHLIPSAGESTPRNPHTTFKGVWSEHRRFEELKLSRWMMSDHMPHNVIKVLRDLSSLHPSSSTLSYTSQGSRVV